MTNQQLFTRVWNHLLTQRKRSENSLTCLYRGPRGLKCAIGCLIPDKKYTQALEGAGVQVAAVRVAAGLARRNVCLAERLQVVHDNRSVSEWEQALRVLAKRFRLRVPPVPRV